MITSPKIYYNPPPLPIVHYCKWCGHAMGKQQVVIDGYYKDDGSPYYDIWLRCVNNHRALYSWSKSRVSSKYELKYCWNDLG